MDSNNTEPAPVNTVSTSPDPISKKKRSLKPFIIAAAAVVVVAGGSAAAYVGVVVPNKPSNVLKKALENTSQQPQATIDGTLNIGSASKDSTSFKVGFTLTDDKPDAASQIKLNVTAAGATLPVEARIIDKNIYVKVGDLSSLTSLLNLSDTGGLTTLAQAVSKEVANKWIVVDSTLLDQANLGCATGSATLTKADLSLLENAYSKHPFVTIVSNASDTVGGKAAQKFELSIDDDKAAVFGNDTNLNDLSPFKQLSKCQKKTVNSKRDAKGDHDKTPITIWVDKSSKRVVKIASHSTAQDAKKGDIKGDLTATINYDKVSVTKPSGATPALTVFNNLQKSLGGSGLDLGSLFGGGSSSFGGDNNVTTPIDTELN